VNKNTRVDEIRGLSGSAGRVTARARVILDPNLDAHIEPGEVLVAPYADIGWTPLFLTASALVTSLGGPLSHACIVAREYRIPAVVNAHGATEIIRTGDLITVDADRGVIYIRERV
jgi:pyruvate,water dikinase